jgi:cytochrome c oxidase assembly protein subunit 15/protoheme IX farnesyltransferase
MLAVLTAVAVIRGAWLLVRRASSPLVTALAKITSAVIATQLAVGALNLALHAPTWMQILHLFVADLLWISLVLLAAAGLGAVQRTQPRATSRA